MTYSEPSDTAELIPVLVDGASLKDLFGVRVTSNVSWLKRPINVGDAGLSPVTPLLEEHPRSNFADYVDGLDVIAKDGLENLVLIGGDGDGHSYLLGTKTNQFFVLWHDPDEFEKVGDTVEEFIQWMIQERSDHLEGCPWELFFADSGSVYPTWDTAWHRRKTDPATIYNKAKEEFLWTHDYVSTKGFELFNSELGFGLRFKNAHRGHISHLRIVADPRSSSKDDLMEFWNWIHRQGFGTDN